MSNFSDEHPLLAQAGIKHVDWAYIMRHEGYERIVVFIHRVRERNPLWSNVYRELRQLASVYRWCVVLDLPSDFISAFIDTAIPKPSHFTETYEHIQKIEISRSAGYQSVKLFTTSGILRASIHPQSVFGSYTWELIYRAITKSTGAEDIKDAVNRTVRVRWREPHSLPVALGNVETGLWYRFYGDDEKRLNYHL